MKVKEEAPLIFENRLGRLQTQSQRDLGDQELDGRKGSCKGGEWRQTLIGRVFYFHTINFLKSKYRIMLSLQE